ncbi:hypothetical protein [Paenibacillus pabuli]|uniref:hypothetical protein n=1 Tax=Paenibacillus pabuli TaxID=1472 RepID=UPI001430E220|nr:hypothetical protein [Paenibacillus pabuli]MEC0125053.1 hypothetical protein [Paenibacillus pabuli]
MINTNTDERSIDQYYDANAYLGKCFHHIPPSMKNPLYQQDRDNVRDYVLFGIVDFTYRNETYSITQEIRQTWRIFLEYIRSFLQIEA